MSHQRAPQFRTNLRIERDNAALYARLAELATDARLAQVYRRIAAGEQANAQFWEARLRELGERGAGRADRSARARAELVRAAFRHRVRDADGGAAGACRPRRHAGRPQRPPRSFRAAAADAFRTVTGIARKAATPCARRCWAPMTGWFPTSVW